MNARCNQNTLPAFNYETLSEQLVVVITFSPPPKKKFWEPGAALQVSLRGDFKNRFSYQYDHLSAVVDNRWGKFGDPHGHQIDKTVLSKVGA